MDWYDQDVTEAWADFRALRAEHPAAPGVALAFTLATTVLASVWFSAASGFWRALWAVIVVLGVEATMVRLAFLVSSRRSDPPRWVRWFWTLHPVRLIRRRH